MTDEEILKYTREVVKEMTTTGNIAGYQTPFAFVPDAGDNIVDSDDDDDEDDDEDDELPEGVVEYFGDSYADGPEKNEVERKIEMREKLEKINESLRFTNESDVTSPEAIDDFIKHFKPLAEKSDRIRNLVTNILGGK